MAREETGISGIAVRGFKSIRDEQHIAIRPLTILAGANSSGKSSIMQPLLLLKQTIEAPVDPGALLLDGPYVRFTLAEQLLSRGGPRTSGGSFSVRLGSTTSDAVETTLRTEPGKGFAVERTTHKCARETLVLVPDMDHDAIVGALPESLREISQFLTRKEVSPRHWQVFRDRCFLDLGLADSSGDGADRNLWPLLLMRLGYPGRTPGPGFLPLIRSVIHLPGLRGNPQRTYAKTAAGPHFPGTFEAYVASIISQWQNDKSDKLAELGQALEELGLSWKVAAKAVDDTQVELRVGRLPHGKRGGAQDLVSVADVGLGVSQVLPVLVAMVVANPGQLVYLEQPEIHLHPKAQRGLAHTLCRAAKRGVRLVVETHSALLLREVQTLVVTGELPKEDVALHWFQRNDAGVTTVSTAELDEHGAFGNWPEDFDATELEAESAFLDAVEAKRAGQ